MGYLRRQGRESGVEVELHCGLAFIHGLQRLGRPARLGGKSLFHQTLHRDMTLTAKEGSAVTLPRQTFKEH